MPRALLLASLLLAGSGALLAQGLSVLRIKVTVVDAERKATPVPRHVLLISDNPPSAPPRAVTVRADGTADVRLRPGKYIVESEQPVAFQGRVYQWTQRVEVAAGRETTLELTADNADADAATPAGASSLESDPAFFLPQWEASVVGVWTPTAHQSGFVIDAKGLIATTRRGIGSATVVEVQVTPEIKVAGRLLAADPDQDVAILWIDSAVVASVKPVPLGCPAGAEAPSLAAEQVLHSIGASMRNQKAQVTGTIDGVEPQAIAADFRLATTSAGGPVFAAGGAVVGMTTLVADENVRGGFASRVVRTGPACEVVALAEKAMEGGTPPSAARLPVDPTRPFPMEALKEIAQRRAGSLSPPQLTSTDFEIAFITPVLNYAAQAQGGWRGTGGPPTPGDALRALRGFSNWSDYVADYPPVLLVRVTPRFVEGFWTTVARGAAMTQGMALPPIKRFKAGFARMQAFCGNSEVTPIHPFRIEQRVGDGEAIYEGLYAFAADALGPQCGSVRLVLFSEKELEKGDSRTVDPKILERIREDFAPYRSAP
jgi:S1-C subfamily serine protease